MENFNSLTIEQKIHNLNDRATKLFCDLNPLSNDAVAVVLYYMNSAYGTPIQAWFTQFGISKHIRNDILEEESFCEEESLNDALNVLNDFLSGKELIRSCQVSYDRTEIVESIGYGD